MRTVRIRAGLVALLLSALATANAEAGGRPRVAVRFEVRSAQYRLALEGAGLTGFCASAERAITGRLGARERYIEFVPGGTEANLLRVAIVPNEAIGGAGGSAGVNLRLTLFRSASDSVFTVWPFLEQSLTIEEPAVLRNIELAFERGDRPDLESELLSAVSIADSCLTLTGTGVQWVIPRTMEDLCTDQGTRLRIQLTLSDGITVQTHSLEAKVVGFVDPQGSLPPLYHGRLVASAVDLAPEVKELLLQHADRVRVDAVYVTDYAPIPSCEEENP